jgi:hypothetical protein
LPPVAAEKALMILPVEEEVLRAARMTRGMFGLETLAGVESWARFQGESQIQMMERVVIVGWDRGNRKVWCLLRIPPHAPIWELRPYKQWTNVGDCS